MRARVTKQEEACSRRSIRREKPVKKKCEFQRRNMIDGMNRGKGEITIMTKKKKNMMRMMIKDDETGILTVSFPLLSSVTLFCLIVSSFHFTSLLIIINMI